jgi:23S rRNA (adenine1618-N6)-methyltransferase
MHRNVFHPRNRHQGRYDLPKLVRASPELARHVVRLHGQETIDFADPAAVKALNRALLGDWYGVRDWDVPPGYLCPPIPGRADHIHSVAELMEGRRNVRVLDIGTGANLVYPIIGRSEYGWSFVATDVDPVALESAQRILDANPALAGGIELRRQDSPDRILKGVLLPGEKFDLVVCNPPFHASQEEAEAGSLRKWRNLGKSGVKGEAPKRNFGGGAGELWCEGGERAFVLRMIDESRAFANQVAWFTTLVSKESNLEAFEKALGRAGAKDLELLETAQGQKKSRIAAWSYRD